MGWVGGGKEERKQIGKGERRGKCEYKGRGDKGRKGKGEQEGGILR